MNRSPAPSSGASPQDRGASTVGELEAVAEAIEASLARGDHAETAALLERHLLEAWFGLSPERFRELLTSLAAEPGETAPVLLGLQALAQGRGEDRFQRPEVQAALSRPGSPEASLMLAARMFELRLRGHPVEAFELAQRLSDQSGVLMPLFDVHRGWALFGSVQSGISAMLAGEFDQALSSFSAAQLHVPVPSLSFLFRDAYVKTALIHACVGDPQRARWALDNAEQIPRTSSWVEDVLDVCAELSEALLDADSSEQAIARLDAIPLHSVGEMWPFFITAQQQVLQRAGERAEAMRRLEMFDAIRLPRVDREGFSGSVLPATMAANCLLAGNPARARELLERADPAVPTTLIVEAMLALSVGKPARALRIGYQLRDPVRGLRQLELWRLGVIAASHLLLEDEASAVETLRNALELPRGLSVCEAEIFVPELRVLAARELPEWPVDPDRAPPLNDVTLLVHRVMSAREQEILGLMAEGRTREEIAEELFISANTMKAHVQSIYRKLGVSNWHAAVLAAERRGL